MFVMSQLICAADLILAAGMVTAPVAALKVAKFVLAGLPDTAALVSVQIAPVITHVLPAGGVSVMTVAVLKFVNVTVPADAKISALVVATGVKMPPLLLVNEKVAGLLTPAVPVPLVLLRTVKVVGKMTTSSTVFVPPTKLVIVAPVAVVVALALLL